MPSLFLHFSVTLSDFLTALVAREPWAISLVLWFVLLLLSQVYDKTLSRDNPNWKLRSIEEMLEVTAALYAVSAISLFSIKKWFNGNNKIPTVESNNKINQVITLGYDLLITKVVQANFAEEKVYSEKNKSDWIANSHGRCTDNVLKKLESF